MPELSPTPVSKTVFFACIGCGAEPPVHMDHAKKTTTPEVNATLMHSDQLSPGKVGLIMLYYAAEVQHHLLLLYSEAVEGERSLLGLK